MEATAPSSSYYSHIETRLSLDAVSSTIVCIQLPSTSTFARSSKASRKVVTALPNGQDEESYRYRRVASSSNVYFRSRKRYPRSILWRCLEDNKVVEVRSLDLSKSHSEPKDKEASVVLRIGFPSHIAKDGVAIADSEEEDAVSLFVLTTNNDLYTITLKPLLFCKATASEDDFDRLVKIFKPASLSIASSFRLKAISAQEVFIGLGDGRLLRLIRKVGEDGSNWHETAYSDGQWGSSLRGLIRWSAGSNSVTYEGQTLDHNTSLGMVLSPDKTHLLSVGLNHTLKFWNLSSGRANVTRDVLDIEREPSEVQKVLIHPSARKVVDTFECLSGYDGDLYYVVTFSPHSSGVFKFWGVRDADSTEHGIRDLFEDDILRAPEPDDGGLWTLSDFKLQADSRSANITVWILMRLNRRYKLYRRQFMDLQSLGNEWSEGWSVTVIDAAKGEPFNEMPTKLMDSGAESISERWLNYILSPGRYAEAAVEAALATVTQGKPQRQNKLSLRERISNTIGSDVYISTSEATADIDQYDDSLSSSWLAFWRTIVEIDDSQWGPLALGFDHVEDTPYNIFANGFSVIRDMSELETLAYNSPPELQKNQDLSLTQSIEMDGSASTPSTADQLAAIVEASARFRASFSGTLKASVQLVLQNELWKDATLAIPERIQEFYDVCDFESEIGDRVYNAIIASLRSYEGLAALSTDAILAIIDSSNNVLPSQAEEKAMTHLGTSIGTKVLNQGIKDVVAIQERILTDLLYLIVFITMEADEEEALADRLDSNQVYSRLLEDLRQVQLTKWLALHAVGGPSNSVSPVSILERDFISSIHPRAAMTLSQSVALTQTIRDVQTYVCGSNDVELSEVLCNIQCVFLKRKDIDSASSFAQYLPSTAWAAYVRGRLHLLKQEYIEAALQFKKAAFKLARSQPSEADYTTRSAGLIQSTEQSSFNKGFADYYCHALSLFSPHQANAQIMQFAELALQHGQSLGLAQRSDVLARLFHAAVGLKDFSVAYAALQRYTDKALQRSALSELVSKMVSNGYVSELISLPVTTLKKDLEKILTEKAEKEIGLAINATPKIPYFKILYAFHIRHKNFRAAASVLISRLEARHARRITNAKQHRFLNSKQEVEKALDEYLIGINALALLAPEDDDSDSEDEAWVFVEDGANGSGGKKRRVMRIEGLRERYQSEMDRIAAIELGRWGIVDEDEEEDEAMDGVENNGTLVSV